MDFFDSGPIPADAPDWFALYIAHESISPPTWIFDVFTNWHVHLFLTRCDELDLESDIQPPPPKKADVPRSGYTHATKIRAAISYFFGHTRNLGRQQWVITEEGTSSGNPSLAPSLAAYMLSLQCRKVSV